jgi:anti-sigma-K factor RskA
MRSNHRDPVASDCDAIEKLIPEYAFGLTDHEETHLVERNLNGCPDAAAQLVDFRRIQDEMRIAVPQMAPPANLEARLMAAAASDIPAADSPIVSDKGARSDAVTAATVVRSQAPRRRFNPVWAAAAIAILALVVTNTYWIFRVDELTRHQNGLSVQSSNVPRDTAFILNSTSGLRWARLPGAKQNLESAAFLMWNAESKIGLMYAANLPKLQPGTVYQLWLTRGEERISAGTFEVDATGKAALLFNCVEPIDKYTWARITIEPASGSAKPTGTPIVIGQLSA